MARVARLIRINGLRVAMPAIATGLLIVFSPLWASHLAAGISQSRLVERIAADDSPVVVDVRTPHEYHAGHVPGAINIPLGDFQRRFEELRPYHNQELVLYCEFGPRASYAGWMLNRLGFQELRFLEGHMDAWRRAALPVSR